MAQDKGKKQEDSRFTYSSDLGLSVVKSKDSKTDKTKSENKDE